MNASPPLDLADELRRYDEARETRAWRGPHYRMTYGVIGRGPARLLLLPGIAGTHRSFCFLANRMSAEYQIVLPTYPGDEPGDRSRLSELRHSDLVEMVAGLVAHLGPAPVDVLGVSFGSTLALAALARWPARFRRAALQGGFARRRLSGPERLALAAARHVPGHLGRLPLHDFILRRNNAHAFPSDDPELWRFFLSQTGATPIAPLASRLSMIADLDLTPVLPSIHHPVLLVHGDVDRVVPPSTALFLGERLPHAKVMIESGVGHQPHTTHPDMMARELVRHFQAVDG